MQQQPEKQRSPRNFKEDGENSVSLWLQHQLSSPTNVHWVSKVSLCKPTHPGRHRNPLAASLSPSLISFLSSRLPRSLPSCRGKPLLHSQSHAKPFIKIPHCLAAASLPPLITFPACSPSHTADWKLRACEHVHFCTCVCLSVRLNTCAKP